MRTDLSDEPSTYSLHGLAVTSSLRISALETSGPADVSVGPIEWAEVPEDPPVGEQLFDSPLHWPLTITRTPTSGYCMRYAGHADFWVDEQLRSVRVVLTPGDDADFAAVLLQGAVFAALTTLRGAYCLHATTVAINGFRVAIAGPSGVGKSTVAATLISEGAKLVADDVSCVQNIQGIGSLTVSTGLVELRLRERAGYLADHIRGVVRRTADGRIAVRPEAIDNGSGELAGIVIPRASRDASEVTLRIADPLEALRWLLPSSRLIGWSGPTYQMQEFQAATALSARLPVAVMDVPWADAYDRERNAELFEAVANIVSGSPSGGIIRSSQRNQ